MIPLRAESIKGRKRMETRRKAAYFGVFTALALIVTYVETLIPFYFGIPGVKLGLTNIVILCVLYFMGAKDACLLSVLRVVLGGFLFGNMYSIIYSLAGGLLSLAVMYLMKRSKGFSIIGVSMCGGIAHNIGQLLVAMAVVDNFNLFYYLPVLLISGLVTGLLIGILGKELQRRLPKEIFK